MFVVAGASGKTGSVVADALLARKKPVRVIVRDEKKGAPWKQKGAEVAIAALEDTAALTVALRGSQGVYLLVPPDFGPDFLASRKRVGDSLAAAVTEVGVPHVVFLSSVGAEKPDGTGPIRGLHHTEAKLSQTKSATTFIRAGYFYENWAALLQPVIENGVLPTALTLDNKIPMVATQDIGTVAAGYLADGPRDQRTVVELPGPEEVAPADVAATFEAILGKPVKTISTTLDDFKKALMGVGATAELAGLYAEMTQALNSGHVALGAKGAILRRGPTPLEPVLRKLLGK